MNKLNLVNDLGKLPEPRKTFMEIMKVNNSEVHMANLLAYFFKSEEHHGLGKVFIEALLETNSYQLKSTDDKGKVDDQNTKLIDHSWKLSEDKKTFEKTKDSISFKDLVPKPSRVRVEIEEFTNKTEKKKKRIDLVLKTDECVVCIEFKINHELNNPLELYQKQIIEIEKEFQEEKAKKREVFFVVLTPYKKKPSELVQKFIDEKKNCFREIILSHFVKNVVKRIPANYFIENIDNYNTQYLVDFIQTIQNREIRYKRTLLLEDLNKLIVKLNINSKYHSNNNGGFIELRRGDAILKIRIKNNKYQIEDWSINKSIVKFWDLNTFDELIVNGIKEIIGDTI